MSAGAIGVIISIGALALAIGGAIISFGRFQGSVGEKTMKHEKDIDGLWAHQRKQDLHCATQTSVNVQSQSRLEATLAAVKENSDETRGDVKEIRNMLMNRGGNQ